MKRNVKAQVIISLKEDVPTKTVLVEPKSSLASVMLQVNVMAH
ncbi:MAG: hypothetical protein O7B35_14995 [Deltaproteobacteria bacterium]|nr:hypothetical protein [Deltaproteobacteria bacterium]